MIVILFFKIVIIFLNHDILPADHPRLPHPKQHFVIYLWSFVDKAEFRSITMRHLLVEFPMQQESNKEPVHPDETIGPILDKEHY